MLETTYAATSDPRESKEQGGNDKDDVFSDSEAKEGGSSKSKRSQQASSTGENVTSTIPATETKSNADQVANVTRADDTIGNSSAGQPGFIGTITKGLVDSSKRSVKAVQVEVHHAVSQN
ncbi:ATG13 domain-containing protein [Psidium guajava]|nr:ATG13 domain-containing protein [Psidium guajava]